MGTSNILVGPAAGTNSVALGVTGAWTNTANASWLHLSAANQDGTNNANVVFTYDANTGPTRAGSLTVDGLSLTVTQAGSNYVAAGILTALVSSGLNEPYGVAVDGAGHVFFTDAENGALKEWSPGASAPVTLVSSGLHVPSGVAVDSMDNVYIADTNAIRKWSAAGGLTTLVSNGLSYPSGVAVDAAGNVYIADSFNEAIKKWSVVNGAVTTLLSSNLSNPSGLAVDAAGNLYIADTDHDAVKKWSVTNGSVTTLVSSGLSSPTGVAVDGEGNVYIADTDNSEIKKWSAANNTLTILESSGLFYPSGVAVDGTGNIFVADTLGDSIAELPRAFVDTNLFVGSAAGTNTQPAVLPSTENLLSPFAPASDTSWLTINGVTNGEITISFTSTTNLRTGQLTVLGQSVAVTQQVSGTVPILLTGLKLAGANTLRFVFTNNPAAAFSVLTTTNLSLPVSGWTFAGTPAYISSNQFQFTTPSTTNDAQRYYIIVSP